MLGSTMINLIFTYSKDSMVKICRFDCFRYPIQYRCGAAYFEKPTGCEWNYRKGKADIYILIVVFKTVFENVQ